MFQNINNNWITSKSLFNYGNIYSAISSRIISDNISSFIMYSISNTNMQSISINLFNIDLDSMIDKSTDENVLIIDCKFDDHDIVNYIFKLNVNGNNNALLELHPHFVNDFRDKLINSRLLKVYLNQNNKTFTLGYFLRNSKAAINSIMEKNKKDIEFINNSYWVVKEINHPIFNKVSVVEVRFNNSIIKDNLDFLYIRKNEGNTNVNFVLVLDSLDHLKFYDKDNNLFPKHQYFIFTIDNHKKDNIKFYVSPIDPGIWMIEDSQDISNLCHKLINGKELKIEGKDIHGISFKFIYPLLGYKESVAKAKRIVKIDNLDL